MSGMHQAKIDNQINREKRVFFGKMSESERLILLLKSPRQGPCRQVRNTNVERYY
jgi:hypothetical protein